MIEVSVRISNEEQKLTKRFAHYDTSGILYLTKDDPNLQDMVKQAEASFKGSIEDITLTFKMIW